MLELVNLSKRFKQNFAVRNMNMYIEQGEIIGLLGPNGAGKSTAIAMLSTLLEPTEGDVLFAKKSVLKKPAALRDVIGLVPQEIALYEELTAQENLHFFGRMHNIPRKELREKIAEILDVIGLTNRKNDVVKRYSGGMKRRLNIGVALLHEPEILIMDEPTVGIDPQSRSHILETVKRLNKEQGLTILYTSHYMEEVEFLCDRIYIMDQGSLVTVGTKQEIKNILGAENSIVMEAELLNPGFIAALEAEVTMKEVALKGNTVTIIVPKEINAFKMVTELAESHQVILKSVHVQAPTLEDVFLHLTGRALRD